MIHLLINILCAYPIKHVGLVSLSHSNAKKLVQQYIRFNVLENYIDYVLSETKVNILKGEIDHMSVVDTMLHTKIATQTIYKSLKFLYKLLDAVNISCENRNLSTSYIFQQSVKNVVSSYGVSLDLFAIQNITIRDYFILLINNRSYRSLLLDYLYKIMHIYIYHECSELNNELVVSFFKLLLYNSEMIMFPSHFKQFSPIVFSDEHQFGGLLDALESVMEFLETHSNPKFCAYEPLFDRCEFNEYLIFTNKNLLVEVVEDKVLEQDVVNHNKHDKLSSDKQNNVDAPEKPFNTSDYTALSKTMFQKGEKVTAINLCLNKKSYIIRYSSRSNTNLAFKSSKNQPNTIFSNLSKEPYKYEKPNIEDFKGLKKNYEADSINPLVFIIKETKVNTKVMLKSPLYKYSKRNHENMSNILSKNCKSEGITATRPSKKGNDQTGKSSSFEVDKTFAELRIDGIASRAPQEKNSCVRFEEIGDSICLCRNFMRLLKNFNDSSIYLEYECKTTFKNIHSDIFQGVRDTYFYFIDHNEHFREQLIPHGDTTQNSSDSAWKSGLDGQNSHAQQNNNDKMSQKVPVPKDDLSCNKMDTKYLDSAQSKPDEIQFNLQKNYSFIHTELCASATKYLTKEVHKKEIIDKNYNIAKIRKNLKHMLENKHKLILSTFLFSEIHGYNEIFNHNYYCLYRNTISCPLNDANFYLRSFDGSKTAKNFSKTQEALFSLRDVVSVELHEFPSDKDGFSFLNELYKPISNVKSIEHTRFIIEFRKKLYQRYVEVLLAEISITEIIIRTYKLLKGYIFEKLNFDFGLKKSQNPGALDSSTSKGGKSENRAKTTNLGVSLTSLAGLGPDKKPFESSNDNFKGFSTKFIVNEGTLSVNKAIKSIDSTKELAKEKSSKSVKKDHRSIIKTKIEEKEKITKKGILRQDCSVYELSEHIFALEIDKSSNAASSSPSKIPNIQSPAAKKANLKSFPFDIENEKITVVSQKIAPEITRKSAKFKIKAHGFDSKSSMAKTIENSDRVLCQNDVSDNRSKTNMFCEKIIKNPQSTHDSSSISISALKTENCDIKEHNVSNTIHKSHEIAKIGSVIDKPRDCKELSPKTNLLVDASIKNPVKIEVVNPELNILSTIVREPKIFIESCKSSLKQDSNSASNPTSASKSMRSIHEPVSLKRIDSIMIPTQQTNRAFSHISKTKDKVMELKKPVGYRNSQKTGKTCEEPDSAKSISKIAPFEDLKTIENCSRAIDNTYVLIPKSLKEISKRKQALDTEKGVVDQPQITFNEVINQSSQNPRTIKSKHKDLKFYDNVQFGQECHKKTLFHTVRGNPTIDKKPVKMRPNSNISQILTDSEIKTTIEEETSKNLTQLEKISCDSSTGMSSFINQSHVFYHTLQDMQKYVAIERERTSESVINYTSNSMSKDDLSQVSSNTRYLKPVRIQIQEGKSEIIQPTTKNQVNMNTDAYLFSDTLQSLRLEEKTDKNLRTNNPKPPITLENVTLKSENGNILDMKTLKCVFKQSSETEYNLTSREISSEKTTKDISSTDVLNNPETHPMGNVVNCGAFNEVCIQGLKNHQSCFENVNQTVNICTNHNKVQKEIKKDASIDHDDLETASKNNTVIKKTNYLSEDEKIIEKVIFTNKNAVTDFDMTQMQIVDPLNRLFSSEANHFTCLKDLSEIPESNMEGFDLCDRKSKSESEFKVFQNPQTTIDCAYFTENTPFTYAEIVRHSKVKHKSISDIQTYKYNHCSPHSTTEIVLNKKFLKEVTNRGAVTDISIEDKAGNGDFIENSLKPKLFPDTLVSPKNDKYNLAERTIDCEKHSLNESKGISDLLTLPKKDKKLHVIIPVTDFISNYLKIESEKSYNMVDQVDENIFIDMSNLIGHNSILVLPYIHGESRSHTHNEISEQYTISNSDVKGDQYRVKNLLESSIKFLTAPFDSFSLKDEVDQQEPRDYTVKIHESEINRVQGGTNRPENIECKHEIDEYHNPRHLVQIPNKSELSGEITTVGESNIERLNTEMRSRRYSQKIPELNHTRVPIRRVRNNKSRGFNQFPSKATKNSQKHHKNLRKISVKSSSSSENIDQNLRFISQTGPNNHRENKFSCACKNFFLTRRNAPDPSRGYLERPISFLNDQILCSECGCGNLVEMIDSRGRYTTNNTDSKSNSETGETIRNNTEPCQIRQKAEIDQQMFKEHVIKGKTCEHIRKITPSNPEPDNFPVTICNSNGEVIFRGYWVDERLFWQHKSCCQKSYTPYSISNSSKEISNDSKTSQISSKNTRLVKKSTNSRLSSCLAFVKKSNKSMHAKAQREACTGEHSYKSNTQKLEKEPVQHPQTTISQKFTPREFSHTSENQCVSNEPIKNRTINNMNMSEVNKKSPNQKFDALKQPEPSICTKSTCSCQSHTNVTKRRTIDYQEIYKPCVSQQNILEERKADGRDPYVAKKQTNHSKTSGLSSSAKTDESGDLLGRFSPHSERIYHYTEPKNASYSNISINSDDKTAYQNKHSVTCESRSAGLHIETISNEGITTPADFSSILQRTGVKYEGIYRNSKKNQITDTISSEMSKGYIFDSKSSGYCTTYEVKNVNGAENCRGPEFISNPVIQQERIYSKMGSGTQYYAQKAPECDTHIFSAIDMKSGLDDVNFKFNQPASNADSYGIQHSNETLPTENKVILQLCKKDTTDPEFPSKSRVLLRKECQHNSTPNADHNSSLILEYAGTSLFSSGSIDPQHITAMFFVSENITEGECDNKESSVSFHNIYSGENIGHQLIPADPQYIPTHNGVNDIQSSHIAPNLIEHELISPIDDIDISHSIETSHPIFHPNRIQTFFSSDDPQKSRNFEKEGVFEYISDYPNLQTSQHLDDLNSATALQIDENSRDLYLSEQNTVIPNTNFLPNPSQDSELNISTQTHDFFHQSSSYGYLHPHLFFNSSMNQYILLYDTSPYPPNSFCVLNSDHALIYTNPDLLSEEQKFQLDLQWAAFRDSFADQGTI